MTHNSLIKDVLTIVDGDEASLPAVDQALAFAALHDACLTIVVVSENIAMTAAVEPYGYALALDVSEDLSAKHLAAVRARVKGSPLEVAVHGLLDDPAVLPRAARVESRYADIVLIPGAERWRHEALRRHITETVLFSGVPVLVVPPQWEPRAFSHVALGWNASLESLRAARTLLMLAEAGATADILVVDALDQYNSGQAVPGSYIARHLTRHGLRAEVHAMSSGKRGAAATLQTFTAQRGADLLVVGGYGHSRTREFVLGGVTRDLIGHQQVPILLVH